MTSCKLLFHITFDLLIEVANFYFCLLDFSIVQHYRSFDSDLRLRWKEWGGAELVPERVANDLLGHLPNGSKVALVGRSKNSRFDAYSSALQRKGFRVRKIVGQTGIEDFCFLSHAQAGVYATAKSTYAKWAALLGSAQNATLYILKYKHNKQDQEDKLTGTPYKWTNKHLSRVIHYPIFEGSDNKTFWR